jgi:hypothetical protein
LLALNEPFAAAIIYPAVLAAWTFMAVVRPPSWIPALIVTVTVFVVGFCVTIMHTGSLEAKCLKDHPELSGNKK